MHDCEAHQQQLPDDGDCSQVICEHLSKDDSSSSSSSSSIDDDERETISTVAPTSTNTVSEKKKKNESSVNISSPAGQSTASSSSSSSSIRKRKFLDRDEFDRRADDKTKRKIAPIQKWCNLVVGNVYRALKIHDIIVNIKGKEQLSHYGEFEDNNERLTNVWLTNIIYEEIMKYNLEPGNVYIKPLGKKKSVASGMEYHNFVIVVDED